MQERWFVTFGFVPMLVGVVALALLRRPSEVPVVAGAAHGVDTVRAAAGGAAGARDGDGYLGVVVAGHTADLGAEIGGSVVRVFVREGARVQAGDPLVYIDPAAASSEARMAEAELAQQMSAVTRAEAQHTEASDLLARLLQSAGAGVPEQTVVSARSREASTRAALEEARAGIDVGKARIHREEARVRKHMITAPFAGTIVMLGVDTGDVVAAGQVVARVISDDLDVRFALPAHTPVLTKLGARVRIRLPGASAVGAEVLGEVTDVLPEVDAASGLVFVRAHLMVDAEKARTFVAGSSVRVVPAGSAP